MSYKIRLTTVIILLLLPTQISFAQQDYTVEHFGIDQGLPDPAVTCILKDRLGYLWVGTYNGLCRYDGYQFKTFLQGNLNIWVQCILEDESGTLWVGTEAGLNRYNRTNESFTTYRIPNDKAEKKTNYETDGVRTIYEDMSGNFWIGTRDGLYSFNIDKGIFTKVKGDPNEQNKLSCNSISVIYQDKTGKLWIGTGDYLLQDGGLNLLNPKSGMVKQFVHDPLNSKSLSNNWVTSIYQDKQGNLWIGTNSGLDKFDFAKQTFIHFGNENHIANTLNGDAVRSISEDDDGNLLIGTYTGRIIKSDLRSGKFYVYSLNNNENHNQSIKEKFMYYDNSGIIWVGTWNDGLFKITLEPKSIFRSQNSVKNAKELGDRFIGLDIKTMYRDNKGIIWIGTTNNGVNSINPDLSIGTSFLSDIPTPNNSIITLFEDKTNKLWVGTVGGLYVIDLKTKKIRKYIHDPKDQNSLGDNQIPAIVEDNNGIVWLGTYEHGIEKYNRKSGTFEHIPLKNLPDSSSLPKNAVHLLYIDSYGYLWAATYKGLARINLSNETFKWYTPKLNDTQGQWYLYIGGFLEDHNGVIWICTIQGIVRFNRKSETFTLYGEANNLADVRVESMLEDKHGNIWLATPTGISMFNPQTKLFRNFGKSYGLNKNYSFAACKDSSGNFYFGRWGGITIFNPDSLYSDNQVPPIVFTSFKFSGRYAQLDSSISVKKNIELNYQQNNFSIEFSALDFINNSQNKYAYKLEGYDKDWIYCGTRHQVTYMNLNYGTYIFRVIGSNSDEVWNQKGASLTITISPPWWGTWWFKVTSILLLFIAAGSTIRYVEMRRIKRKMELLEQERALEHERTRISRDMHDEIGSNLSEISILSELAKKNPENAEHHVQEISELTAEVIDNVSEIVWAINPQNDRLDNLIAHTRRYAVKYLGLANINCIFTSPENIPGHLVSAEFRRNIFLVVKETLHNIVKHSSATEVLFVVNFSDHNLEIKIEDNGKGLSLEKSQTSGNGLSNMKKRIEDVGGAIAIRSTQGKGTRIDFSAKINY